MQHALRLEQVLAVAQGLAQMLPAHLLPVGQIGDWKFEVGAITREIALDYEKLVRS